MVLVEDMDELEEIGWAEDVDEEGWIEVESRCDDQGNVYFVKAEEENND